MIYLDSGLKNSLIVLEFLRNMNVEKHVAVGTFTNCRECGLTFRVMENGRAFTWCVYEHRNSDDIIINGKEGYVSSNGDLPYMADDKWSYITLFSYNQHYEVAEKLASLINEF